MSDKAFNLVYRNDLFSFKHKLDLAEATRANHNIKMAEIVMRNHLDAMRIHHELEAMRTHHELEAMRFKYRAKGMGAVGLGLGTIGLGLAGVGIAV